MDPKKSMLGLVICFELLSVSLVVIYDMLNSQLVYFY